MPVSLPTGMASLPPLGGRLFAIYRVAWWLLLVIAIAAATFPWVDPGRDVPAVMALRLAKSAVLIAVAAILFRRRGRDSVAVMLSLAFLLWTVSSSTDFVTAAGSSALVDRFRFLFFALALLLFPDADLQARWVRPIGAAIVTTFLMGVVEELNLLSSTFFLPVAIGCVVAALAALAARYRSTAPGVQKQQLKWVMLGLCSGIALIVSARSGSLLTAGMPMPLVGSILLEAMFQFGIIFIALGFLVSLLRYRLYDAEAAISRSAIYAALTISLVGIFAACEALIELLGQRYLGSNVGSLSGAVAAAIAAVLLTPLHGKITDWVERYFQHDLVLLKEGLPELLATLAGTSSIKRVACMALPRIEKAVQSTRMALLVDGRLVATQGIAHTPASKLLRSWQPSGTAGPVVRNEDEAFPLGMALRCPFGGIRGWLLLGPRPDGSYYGKEDVEALRFIAPSFQRTLFLVADREAEERRQRVRQRAMSSKLASLDERLAALEKGIGTG